PPGLRRRHVRRRRGPGRRRARCGRGEPGGSGPDSRRHRVVLPRSHRLAGAWGDGCRQVHIAGRTGARGASGYRFDQARREQGMSSTREIAVVIVGAGPAGLAAALYTGRAMLSTVVLEKGAPGGELLNTEFLEDVPGFSKILGRELAVRYHEHAAEFGAEFVLGANVDRVTRRKDGSFETVTDGGDTYVSPAVIITAGGTPLKLGIPGELEYAGRGVSYCAVCDGAFYRNHHVVVVGGGDAACEEADYLTRF